MRTIRSGGSVRPSTAGGDCARPPKMSSIRGLVGRWAERNPGVVDQSDAEIAREMLKMVRRSMERHGYSL